MRPGVQIISVDPDFRNLTKLVSPFLDFYTFRYWIYKLAQTKLETVFRKRKTGGNLIRPGGPKA
jgi:hypothetical protein